MLCECDLILIYHEIQSTVYVNIHSTLNPLFICCVQFTDIFAMVVFPMIPIDRVTRWINVIAHFMSGYVLFPAKSGRIKWMSGPTIWPIAILNARHSLNRVAKNLLQHCSTNGAKMFHIAMETVKFQKLLFNSI